MTTQPTLSLAIALLGALAGAVEAQTFPERVRQRADALRTRYEQQRTERERPRVWSVGARGRLNGETSNRLTPAPAPTRYPIVLAHGLGGFDQIGPIENFKRVPGHLRELGCRVLVTDVAAFGIVEVRARQLREQILAAFPDPAVKVNIIAHSMGGLDARTMIVRHGMAERVASLTTLSTPHHGSPVADAALERVGPRAAAAIDLVINRWGWDWDCVRDLSTDYLREIFNPRTPDDPRVHYQSYGAAATPRAESGARTRPLLWKAARICEEAAGPNDGLVPVSSARRGEWRGVLPADHFGVIGRQRRQAPFDHLAFYGRVVTELGDLGF